MTVAPSADGREYDEDDAPQFDDVLFERRMQVLSLRNGGMTYRQISEALSISPDTARRDEIWGRRHVAGDDIESTIAVHRSVILDGRRANYRRYLEGDKDATTAIFKGLDHEAKLLGLYAPTRIQTGPSHDEFSERAAELIAAVSPNTLKELLRGTHLDPYAAGSAVPAEPEPLDVEVVAPVPAGTDSPAGAPEPDGIGPFDADDWSNI